MPAPPVGLPRLLPTPAATALPAHLARLGPLPDPAALVGRLVRAVEEAGLRGRGGAGFPTGLKLAAVVGAAGRRTVGRRRVPIVVANGTEGEPASTKDVMLLSQAPHLVLDGAVAAALAVGASEAVVCVDRADRGAVAAVGRAVAERAVHRLDPVWLRVVTTPSRYVAGEETALVHFLNGGEAKPTFTPPRPFQRGVEGRPTLVDNVETLANVALIARFGAGWWRSVGTAADPGSILATISGGVARPGVYELPLGVRLGAVLQHAGAGLSPGILLGGHFGTWLTPDVARHVRLSVADLARVGAGLGCGVIAVLPPTACPLVETARVARWLAGESAGQCGPCVFGLPAIADALDATVAGDPKGRAEAELRRRMGIVAGRGACKLPDGVVRLVTSALSAFGAHIAEHRIGLRCGADAIPVLPTPPRPSEWR
jgi:NADH:ubiquinone oxidoreductase subunit F (NADH-binding)